MSILKIKDNQGDWVEIPSVSPGPNRIQITNTVVAAVDFSADSTYENFPYRAAIAIANVDSTMTPDIIFAPTDAASGKFCSTSNTYNGGVYIYALEIPEADITIPTIICWYAPSRVLGGSDTIAVTSVNDITPDNAGNVDLTPDAVGAMTWTKIWENASPTSAFAAQIIDLALSEYDCIQIFFRMSVSADDQASYTYKVGEKGILTGFSQITTTCYSFRRFTTNNERINFDAGWLLGVGSATVVESNNSAMIPVEIYGIKGVQ